MYMFSGPYSSAGSLSSAINTLNEVVVFVFFSMEVNVISIYNVKTDSFDGINLMVVPPSMKFSTLLQVVVFTVSRVLTDLGKTVSPH